MDEPVYIIGCGEGAKAYHCREGKMVRAYPERTREMGTAAEQHEDKLWHARQEERARALADAAPALLHIAKIFIGEDDRFQIAVGGNPIAVDRMLEEVRATIAAAEARQRREW